MFKWWLNSDGGYWYLRYHEIELNEIWKTEMILIMKSVSSLILCYHLTWIRSSFSDEFFKDQKLFRLKRKEKKIILSSNWDSAVGVLQPFLTQFTMKISFWSSIKCQGTEEEHQKDIKKTYQLIFPQATTWACPYLALLHSLWTEPRVVRNEIKKKLTIEKTDPTTEPSLTKLL